MNNHESPPNQRKSEARPGSCLDETERTQWRAEIPGLHFLSKLPCYREDIGRWDTRQVTTMYAMFYQATSFNQDSGRCKWVYSNDRNTKQKQKETKSEKNS